MNDQKNTAILLQNAISCERARLIELEHILRSFQMMSSNERSSDSLQNGMEVISNEIEHIKGDIDDLEAKLGEKAESQRED
jgi:hypothetical protein